MSTHPRQYGDHVENGKAGEHEHRRDGEVPLKSGHGVEQLAQRIAKR
jgi:hypothetical protein